MFTKGKINIHCCFISNNIIIYVSPYIFTVFKDIHHKIENNNNVMASVTIL